MVEIQTGCAYISASLCSIIGFEGIATQAPQLLGLPIICFVQYQHVSLWTSWSSLLGMAGV